MDNGVILESSRRDRYIREIWVLEHAATVLSGKSGLSMRGEFMQAVKAGDIFYVAPGHDSWEKQAHRLS